MRLLTSLLAFLLGAIATFAAEKDAKLQKQDLETLLAATLPFAEQMLASHGEFYPYGGTMDEHGKITSVGGYTGDEHPKSTEVIDLLKSAYRRDGDAGKIMACALVYDVRTIAPGQTQKTDAVAIDLDHCEGLSIIMMYPYKIGADKKVTLAAPFAQKGKGAIFKARTKGEPQHPANGSQPSHSVSNSTPGAAGSRR